MKEAREKRKKRRKGKGGKEEGRGRSKQAMKFKEAIPALHILKPQAGTTGPRLQGNFTFLEIKSSEGWFHTGK